MPQDGRDLVAIVGEALLKAHLVDEAGLERAKRAFEREPERFDLVVTRLGLVSESSMVKLMAELRSLPIAATSSFPDQALLTDVIPLDFVRKNRIIPLSETNSEVLVATANAFNDEACAALSYLLGRGVRCSLTTPSDFDKAFEALYGADSTRQKATNGEIDHEASDGDLERLRDIASHAPIIQLVNKLIFEAVELKASDIHLEPLIDGMKVRYRIDGELRSMHMLPSAQKAAIASRIKIMGRLNIAERRLPQDGRIRTALRGQDVDFRVSTMPTQFGESIVLRILDKSSAGLDLGALGLGSGVAEKLTSLLQAPNGLILVTGPTGSGKTTTLYAALKTIDRERQKVFTVEDPIEYQLAGTNQIQVQSKIGLDFAAALRSILRQDPDVILVGEIRDGETAKVAIQASLTGHLVLATLHTNSAAAAITRLVDMGIERYLLASCLRAVLAQRLVRKLCATCSIADELGMLMLRERGHVGTLRARKPSGCSACRSTGFAGRTSVAELLVVDEAMQKLIGSGQSEEAIEAKAVAAGMVRLYEDGLRKIAAGETNLDEVARVASTGGE